MTLLFVVICIVVVAFGAVVLVGPPYLPILKPQMETALELLNLKPGQTLLELGAGDGRVLKAAAQRGWNVVGIELNLFLVVIAWLRTWRYRKQVRIIWGNYWQVEWPPADAVFTFMLQKYMTRLDKNIEKWRNKPLKLVSFAFYIPGKKADVERNGLFVYDYGQK